MAIQSAGQGAAAPQMSYCLAAVGRFASSDGSVGGSEFKYQLINKSTTLSLLINPIPGRLCSRVVYKFASSIVVGGSSAFFSIGFCAGNFALVILCW